MSTPFPQSSLDQAARDAAANKPQNILDHWKKRIMQMPGFQKPAPAPTSSQAQTTRDAKAGADAIKKMNAASSGASLVGGSVAGAVTAPLILGGSEDANIKWRRLGYPSKAAYDTAVNKNAHREKPISADNPVRSSNASDINKRLAQQKKEREAALAVTKGNYDHSSGSFEGQSSGRSGGDVTTTNENGVTQTMKPMSSTSTPIDMSRSFNSLLNGVGQQPFGGSQLPTTMGNPYTATYKQTQGFGDEIPDIGGYNGATFDSELGRLAASSKDISKFAPMTGREVPISFF